MLSPARLESYMRRAAATTCDVVELPPFVMFFNPTDPLVFYNYARPLDPISGNLEQPLSELRAAFEARNRLPRFEFIEEFAPDFAPVLDRAGFVREGRYLLMTCTPNTFQPAPGIPGLQVSTLDTHSRAEDLLALLVVQQQAFSESGVSVPSAADAERLREELDHAGAFLARLDGRPVGGCNFTTPLEGLTELVGIGTLEAYRRQGIATTLTAYAAQAAFERGVKVAFLSAGDERAGRVYARVGFKPYAHSLAYVEKTGE